MQQGPSTCLTATVRDGFGSGVLRKFCFSGNEASLLWERRGGEDVVARRASRDEYRQGREQAGGKRSGAACLRNFSAAVSLPMANPLSFPIPLTSSSFSSPRTKSLD